MATQQTISEKLDKIEKELQEMKPPHSKLWGIP